MEPHPIRMVVGDDLRRSRLTVFFRLLLAIPHLVWLWLWSSIALFPIAPIAWILTLVRGTLPRPLWDFYAALVRYTTHVYAYIFLAANPFPGFVGKAGSYPIDLEIAPPERQNRWKTAFRMVLVLPALYLATVLLVYAVPQAGIDESTGQGYAYFVVWGVSAVVSFLAWWACLVRGRMPSGFRDLLVYGLRYGAQTWGYLLFLTDRYPDADPSKPPASQPTPSKPVGLRVAGDLRRSRLTVFFRLLLTIPHFVWLALWGVAVFVTLIVGWFATLITGRLPEALHRFIAAYVRYVTHVYAFLTLVANPFPGFAGTAESYPVDVEIAPPAPQNRWKTLFRLLLAIPAHIVASVLTVPLELVAIFGWFVGLVLGRMPAGLRNLGAYVLRYQAQTYAYSFLLTDSYPFSGPSEYVKPVPAFDPEGLPAWPGPLRPPSLSS
jgi:Domain of unknown function (DUF4389)